MWVSATCPVLEPSPCGSEAWIEAFYGFMPPDRNSDDIRWQTEIFAGAPVIVPNTVGVTNVPTTAFNLSSPWNVGSNLLLRWVDDNGDAPSPDQILGLNNVSIMAP